MMVGRILSLLTKYSLLFLNYQHLWAAANLMAFPATYSNVGTNLHPITYGQVALGDDEKSS